MTASARPFPFTEVPGLDVEPEYLALQRDEPVARVRFPFGDEAWLVTRHRDVRTVLTDPRFSRAASLGRDLPRVTPENPFSGGIVAMDPPEHSRVRGVCRGAFTPRTVARLRERAAGIAHRLLDDALVADDRFEVIEQFSVPYTLMMLCDMLGVPYEDHTSFRVWAEAGLASTSISEDERWAATGQMWDYIAALVERRRAEPRDDLISAMLATQDEHGSVTDVELVMLVMTILVAGYETTQTQLPNFLYVLLEDRTRYDEIVADPSIVATAVEELLRFVPLEAYGASPRYPTVDVELSGVVVPADAPVIAVAAAADRDPEVFDDPQRLDLRRTPNPHLGFGAGAHFCLGAPLARMELQVALEVLAGRLPWLALDGAPGAIAWKTGMFVRGPSRLVVAAGAERIRETA